MDGNGRWATARGKTRLAGHSAGVEVASDVVRYAIKYGIPYLSLYAFSTENANRPKAEVQGLMRLARSAFAKSDKLNEQGIRILISGTPQGLDDDLVRSIGLIEKSTANNRAITVNICFNYGGRRELSDAVNKIIASGVKSVDEQSLRNYMYHGELPDCDVIVRTGGYMRLSNFLIYQSSYSELYFTDTLWPDFSENEFLRVLEYFKGCKRNFGKV